MCARDLEQLPAFGEKWLHSIRLLVPSLQSASLPLKKEFYFILFVKCIYFERERERVRVRAYTSGEGEAQRKRNRESQAGSMLSVQSPAWGLNS